MTGVEFEQIFDFKSDKAYSAFLNSTKKNRLFKEALICAIEDKYKEGQDQKAWDELSSVIRTDEALTPHNNRVWIGSIPVLNATRSGIIYTIITGIAHGLAVGDAITVTGVAGFTPALSGSYTVAGVPSTTSFQVNSPTTITGTATASTGYITTAWQITDYHHLLSIKAKFLSQVYDLTISDASNATPIVITFNERNSFRTGEQIQFSGILGNTAANGTFYIKKISEKKFGLYADKAFQSPVVGNGTYVSNTAEKIYRIYDNWCKPYVSDRKIAITDTPTLDYPKFEMTRRQIRVYPEDYSCTQVRADYISTSIKYIDVADANTDLELYFPYKFLTFVADTAKRMLAGAIKDMDLFQTATLDLKDNP